MDKDSFAVVASYMKCQRCEKLRPLSECMVCKFKVCDDCHNRFQEEAYRFEDNAIFTFPRKVRACCDLKCASCGRKDDMYLFHVGDHLYCRPCGRNAALPIVLAAHGAMFTRSE